MSIFIIAWYFSSVLYRTFVEKPLIAYHFFCYISNLILIFSQDQLKISPKQGIVKSL